MSRRTSIGAFAAVLVGSVLLPIGSSTAAPAANPAAAPLAGTAAAAKGAPVAHATAGAGQVTAEMKSEIASVLSRGEVSARRAPGAKLSPAALAKAQIRCADFEGQRYCLHSGWTEKSESEVANTVASRATISARGTTRETTGDLSDLDALRQFNALSPAAKRKAERRELVQAARSVSKVWLLRHQIQGTPLPAGFLARHPEVDTGSATSTARAINKTAANPAVKRPRDYPRFKLIMNKKRVTQQVRTYWCGPSSMQMIGWGWNRRKSQRAWANRLGTTTSGTAITEMVRVTNQYTGWDRKRRAGHYITLDISNYSFPQWWMLQMRHYADYRAPVILHPILLKQFYPYLDDDASGHFQVGRGYSKNGKRPAMLHYFEPWNQKRFDPSEPFISRTQRRMAYRSYRANQAHFQHNIGV
ncbi:MAG: C39 family peptidase [Nocardioides sp.]|nr:C39 family peptidase [Nocardioides sp.]